MPVGKCRICVQQIQVTHLLHFFSTSFCDNIFYIEKDDAGNNISEPYSEPWKTSKVGHFAKTIYSP